MISAESTIDNVNFTLKKYLPISASKFLVPAALIIFPSCVVVVKDVSGLVALLAAFFGMVSIIITKKERLSFSSTEKILSLTMASLFLSAVFTSVYNSVDLASANRFASLILTIPIYIFFKNNGLNEKYIWLGLVSGALITMGVALYQKFGLTLGRPHGSVNAILFGDIAMITGCMSLAGMGWFRQQSKWMTALPIIAFAGGVIASALSLSRGGWIALPFLGLILIVYSARHMGLKTLLPILSLFALLLASIYFLPQINVQGRVTDSITQLHQYLASGPDLNAPVRNTSIGVRLEMWRASWLIFIDNPLAGVGWGNYRTEAKLLAEQGLINTQASIFYHSHNQFFSALAKGGSLGFLALSMLFLVPFIIFYQHARREASDRVNRIALAGLLLVVGFVCFSGTEAIIERSRAMTFYAFYLSVFMAAILKQKADD